MRIGVQSGVLFLGFGSIQRKVPDEALWGPLAALAEFAISPRTVADLEGFLADLGTPHAGQVLELLRPLLIGSGSIDVSSRYARHLAYYRMSGADPNDVQSRLAGAHVILVGVGGIGCLVAANLATAGVGRLTLVDADRVELSNLTRQLLYRETDVDGLKVEAAREQILARHSPTVVEALPLNVAGDLSALPAADFLVLSADSPGIVLMVNAHCNRLGLPWLHACYVNDVAAWGPLVVPGVTGCWDCRSLVARGPWPTDSVRASAQAVGARFKAPSFGPVNMLVSAAASLDVLRFLGGFGTPESWNRRVGLHTAPGMTVEYQDCERDVGCLTCQSWTAFSAR